MSDRTKFLLVAVLLGAACDSGGESTSVSIAAAMGHVVESVDQADTKVHAAERMQTLRDRADADARQAKVDAYEALIVVPKSVPGKLGDACVASAQAFDAFTQKRLQGVELQRWEATKQPDLDKLEASCRGLGSVEVAACQTHAFTEAGVLFAAEDAPFILSKCEEHVGVTSTKTAAL